MVYIIIVIILVVQSAAKVHILFKTPLKYFIELKTLNIFCRMS